ncbi:bifunctional 3-phenylpropionate/cinnamic acid dioxygenase ferredoxin subunit [Sporichthya sp.]|uniref:bifunctional 3-phenylpropionate/cinnamic acid dioxygenase ferredoxin subunit n=1 Tax=Sporichthya sp. TaxID=65475 RepID=UPI0017F8C57D|nr:bifunctional 3-phenylpropionate/cinnamic acid dioxygenase ferredoxin subunit [Sporichthya sp.]MBA3742961.1 bifunctional 3-phenylpropionate/cinnamic acid dioxygenase ferredoxin subunit [Sporichthya sp.]
MQTATQAVEVCPVTELPAGEIRLVEIEPPISVFNVGGLLFAIDDTCTHAKASLSDGDVEIDGDDCYVECPFHLAQFDLRTGRPSLPASKPVRTHTVEICDGLITVLVGIVPALPGTPTSS